jgi:predicted HAD superfamily hydrolase/glycosyltransferase involved in cell wall biosynthesis
LLSVALNVSNADQPHLITQKKILPTRAIKHNTTTLFTMSGKAAIITRTKDRPNFLRRAMLSVLNQTYKDWVHVIVNDGGKRNEIELLAREFEDLYAGRLQILHLPESVGMQSASNAGIEASESDYLIIHDDDDSLYPTYLARTIGFLAEAGPDSEFQGVVTQTWRIDEDIDTYGNFYETGRSHYMPLKFVNILRFGAENPFPPIAFLYRRAVHEKIGLFNQRYNVLGDWDFHYRFIQNFEIGVIDKMLAHYHWRVGTQPAGFSNTVTTGVEEHHMQLNKLHNDYMRKHIESSPEVIAPMMSLGRELHKLQDAKQEITSLQKDLTGLIKELSTVRDRFSWLLQRKAKTSDRPKSAPQYEINEHPQPLQIDRAKYLKTAQRRKLISFDIFDTCLLRTTQRPIDVFIIIESLIDLTLNGESVPFARARTLAEQRARKNAPNGEITFDAIYAELAALLQLTPEQTNTLRELELKVEQQVLYPNKIIQDLYNELKNRGKRIIFISDMYFPKEILREFLNDNGYEGSEIYVSCEHKKSKHEGSLYDLVLDEEGVEGPDVLHFGDNYHSDIVQAQRRGFKIGHIVEAHLPQTYFANSPQTLKYNPNRSLTAVAIGLAQKHRVATPPENRNYWETFGYEIAGPIYFFYVKWLIQQAKEAGRKNLIFLARDGYYLDQVFKLVDEEWSTGLDSQYLYASRRLFNLPAITALDKTAMAFLTTPNPNMKVKDFLIRLEFDPTEYTSQVKQAGLSSLEETMATPNGIFKDEVSRNKIEALMRILSSEIIGKAESERAQLFDYFDSVKLDADQALIVDVGWQASSVKSLSRLISLKNNKKTRLAGCYFGTWHFAQPVVDAGNDIRSFFHHLNEPAHRSDLINQSVSIIESIFSAPHPTIIGIKNQNDTWQAVYAEAHEHTEADQREERIWKGAQQFVQDILPLSSESSKDDGLEFIESLLVRILRSPTKEDATKLGSILHRESFGNTRASKISMDPPRSSNGKKLNHGLSQSNWKQGYLAQLTERKLKKLYKQT